MKTERIPRESALRGSGDAHASFMPLRIERRPRIIAEACQNVTEVRSRIASTAQTAQHTNNTGLVRLLVLPHFGQTI